MFTNDDFEMDNTLIEFIKEQAQNFKLEKDSDFEINQENYSKVVIITCLLKRISNLDYDIIHEIEMKPRFKTGCVIADFTGLSLKEKSLSDFVKILQLSDDVGIDAHLDGSLHMEFLVKNVFRQINF